jgi:hypothetical protein
VPEVDIDIVDFLSVGVEILDWDHVDRANGAAVMVVSQKRPCRQSVRINIRALTI